MGCIQGSNCLIFIRLITLGLLITAINYSSTAQLNPKALDTLDSLFKEKEYVEYLTKIRKIEEKNIESNDIRCDLEDMTHFVERQIITDDLDIIFEKRRTNMFHASRYKKISDYQTALKYYLIAHSLVEDKFLLDTFAWFIENEILNIYTRKDNFEKGKYYGLLVENSLIHYEQWEKLSRHFTNMGINYIATGNLKESKLNYSKGLEIATKYQENRGIFSNSQGLVEFYLNSHQLDSAEKYLIISARILPKIKSENKYLEYKSDFEDKKSQYFQLIGNLNLSIEWIRKSIITLREYYKENSKNRELAKAYHRCGMLFLKKSQIDSADLYFKNGLYCLTPIKIQDSFSLYRHLLYQENTFIELFDLKTNILKKQFEFTQNITQLEKALLYNELILWLNNNTTQNTLGDNTKLLNISDSKKYVGIGLDLLYTLNANQKINSSDSIFRNYFNYSKAQLINTKLFNKLIIDQLDKKSKIKIDTLNDKIISLDSIPERTNDQNLHLIQAKIELENIIKQAEQTSLNKNYPKNYIEYSVQQDYIFRLAQLNNKIYFDRIGETVKFDSLFKAFIDTLVNKDPNQHTPIYKQISDFLLQGIDSILPYEFTVIPDANISFIPFDCLKNPFNKNLIESHLISYSHTYGNSISKDHSNSKEIYTLAPKYDSLHLASLERGSTYGLKHAVEECQQIQNYYPDAKSLSRHITKNNLLDSITNASIFHFAGHGKVSNDSSYLILANNQEHLRYEDISNYYNNLDLVVLSACETGLGKWNPGDGSKSLAKAFIESGTGAVVYSLWNMNDDSTQKIMGHFYHYLSKGQAKDEALRNAKLSYINESLGAEKQNFYWAGFVATGDMAPILQTNPILHFLQNYCVIGVTICFLLIIGIIHRFNKF